MPVLRTQSFQGVTIRPIVLTLVVQGDNAIHCINHYPVDSLVCFANTYPMDSDLSTG